MVRRRMISRSPFSVFTITSKLSSLPYFLRSNVLNTSSSTFIIVGRSIFSASLNSWKLSMRLILAITQIFRSRLLRDCFKIQFEFLLFLFDLMVLYVVQFPVFCLCLWFLPLPLRVPLPEVCR